MLIDRYGREITYLRVSVTDRCNFRCVYCMPAQGVVWKKHEEILSYEEITTVVRTAAELGIKKVRLTGGEPLVRRDVEELIRSIASIPQIEDISLTTNGYLLEEKAEALAKAGLTRVNVSLDTIDPEKFARITRGPSLDRVWKGIEAAEKAGLVPIKINAVVVRGVNDDELMNLASLTLKHPWHVRFIELMPVGNQDNWGEGFPTNGHRYVSVQEMQQTLLPLQLEEIETSRDSGPAREFRAKNGIGTVGFISPLGQHFCPTCNRLRLTADGNLRPCLLIDREIPIREALREGKDIADEIRNAIELKPKEHELDQLHSPTLRKMAQIGG